MISYELEYILNKQNLIFLLWKCFSSRMLQYNDFVYWLMKSFNITWRFFFAIKPVNEQKFWRRKIHA